MHGAWPGASRKCFHENIRRPCRWLRCRPGCGSPAFFRGTCCACGGDPALGAAVLLRQPGHAAAPRDAVQAAPALEAVRRDAPSEGCLLAGGQLRHDRRGPAAGAAHAGSRGRRLPQPGSPAQPAEGLRRGGRRGCGDPRHGVLRWPVGSGARDEPAQAGAGHGQRHRRRGPRCQGGGVVVRHGATARSPSSAPAGATPTRRCSATSSRTPSMPTPRCATWWATR